IGGGRIERDVEVGAAGAVPVAIGERAVDAERGADLEAVREKGLDVVGGGPEREVVHAVPDHRRVALGGGRRGGGRDVVVVEGLDDRVVGVEADAGDVPVVGGVAGVGAHEGLEGGRAPRDVVVGAPALVRVGKPGVVPHADPAGIERGDVVGEPDV